MSNDAPTLILSQPIRVELDQVTMLTFREPTGRDLAACGVMAVKSMATAEFGGYMREMIARLAGIPPSSVDLMSALDWTNAMTLVLGFLAPPKTPAPPSGSTSTPDTSSAS